MLPPHVAQQLDVRRKKALCCTRKVQPLPASICCPEAYYWAFFQNAPKIKSCDSKECSVHANA